MVWIRGLYYQVWESQYKSQEWLKQHSQRWPRCKLDIGIKEVSPDMNDASWWMIGMRSSEIYHPPINVMNDMSNNAAKMNYHALLAEFDQEELENCKVGLVGARP